MNDISTWPDSRGGTDRLAALMACVPMPMWLIDEAGLRVVAANDAARSLMGPDEPRHLLGDAFAAAGASDEAADPVRFTTRDGQVRAFAMTFRRLPDMPRMIVATAQDVTARVHAEAQLRQLRAELAHVARISILGELATSIAHEVRQPLAAIVTNADTSLRWLARDEPNLAKVGELTARIAASAQRASDIIQRVRGMAQKHAPELSRLDLVQVVDEAVALVRHDIETRGIELSVQAASGLPAVLGDGVQLQQVVVNLLINAAQALDRPETTARRIALTVEAAGGRIVLGVRDTGPGIDHADLPHLFEGFFTTKPAGLGVGLAICRAIVTGHGGEIDAGNDPGGGALFRVALPVDRRPG